MINSIMNLSSAIRLAELPPQFLAFVLLGADEDSMVVVDCDFDGVSVETIRVGSVGIGWVIESESKIDVGVVVYVTRCEESVDCVGVVV